MIRGGIMKERINYLMICENCGTPKIITPHVIRKYWTSTAVKVEYCKKCQRETEIPAYLKQLVDELTK